MQPAGWAPSPVLGASHSLSPLFQALSSHLTLCFLKASSWGRGVLPRGSPLNTQPQGDRAPSLAPPTLDSKPRSLSCSEPARGWVLGPPHADSVPGPGLGWETPGFMVQGPGVRIALRHVVTWNCGVTP